MAGRQQLTNLFKRALNAAEQYKDYSLKSFIKRKANE